jgi:hypothetical protein
VKEDEMSDYPEVDAAVTAFQPVAQRLADVLARFGKVRVHRFADAGRGVAEVDLDVCEDVDVRADWVSAGRHVEVCAAVPPVNAAATLDAAQCRTLGRLLLAVADALDEGTPDTRTPAG